MYIASLSVINEVRLIEETKASADTHTAWPMINLLYNMNADLTDTP